MRDRREPHTVLIGLVAVVAIGFHAPELPAQPVAGKSQPDRVDFGTVRVGAIVEGSVRVFAGGSDTGGVSVKVEPPPFVRVKTVELGTQDYGGRVMTFCDVTISMVTDTAGELTGPMTVDAGGLSVEVPVNVNVWEQVRSASRVLVVETPFDRFSTRDASIFENWLAVIESGAIDPNYLDVGGTGLVLRDLDLSKFDVVLLGESGLFYLRDPDVAKLHEFVSAGGRLIVCANAFMVGSVEKANGLLKRYGLQMTDTEPRGTREFEVIAADIVADPLTKNALALKFFRPSPVSVTDKSKGKILVKAPPFPGDGFIAVSRSGKGEVVALGQSLWWNWIGGSMYQGSDNHRLMENLLVKDKPKRAER